IAWLFGNSGAASILLGCCLALSYTAIVMQLINEQKALGTPLGQPSLSILLLQDLAAVPLLLLVNITGAPEQNELMSTPALLALAIARLRVLPVTVLVRWALFPVLLDVLRLVNGPAFISLIRTLPAGAAALSSLACLASPLRAFLPRVRPAAAPYC